MRTLGTLGPPRLVALLVAAGWSPAAGVDFSVTRAQEHIRVLAGEIGPRKTGSDEERRAFEYVAGVMEAMGLEPRRIPVDSLSLEPGTEVVARTMNLHGVLPGERRDTILIGAHIDSRNRTVPGALDDASGAAVVLEVARALIDAPPRSTVWFVLFGAEEEGCVGSRHFAAHEDLSDLRLVVTLDPVGRGRIFVAPFPDPPALGWMRGLERIGRRTGLGARILTDPLYALAPRFLQVPHLADHAPFQERGIPALNLSSEFELWEYHTLHDRVERVQPDTVAAAGRAVLELVRGFDAGRIRPEEDPHFFLIRLPGIRWFVRSRWLYLAAAIVGAAALFTAVRRIRRGGAVSLAVSGLRCAATVAAVAAVALSGLFLAEWVAERWTGFRFPWYTRQGISLAMAAALAAAPPPTTWVSLRLFRRLRPAEEPEPFLAAAGFLLAAGAAAGFGSGFPEAGFLFVPPLAGILAGLPAKRTAPRLLAALLGWIHIPGLVSPRAYRAALRFAGLEVPAAAGFVILLLLLLPLALVLFGLSFRPDQKAWRRALHPNVLVACLVGYAACLGGWMERRSYDQEHRRTIRVEEWADMERGEAGIDLASQENLKGVRVLRPAPEAIDPAGQTWSRRLPVPPDLFTWHVEESPDPEAIRAVALTLDLERPADRVRVRFRSPGGFLLPPGGPDGGGGGWEEVDSLEWRYVHALTRLEERYRLWPAAPEALLAVELEVGFEEDWFGWEFQAEDSVFIHRGRIRAARTLPARQVGAVRTR